jgi:hypothetical protein
MKRLMTAVLALSFLTGAVAFGADEKTEKKQGKKKARKKGQQPKRG